MSLSSTSTRIPRDKARHPRWAWGQVPGAERASSSQCRRPNPHSLGSCGSWSCLPFLFLFKEKTKLSTLPTCEMPLARATRQSLHSHTMTLAQRK